MNTTKEAIALVKVRRLAADGTAATIREMAGLSLAEMGDAVGASQSTVWRWERGERTPRGPAAIAYADLLDRLAEEVRPHVAQPV